MERIPQRTSLVAQTTAILRERIQSGVWTQWLPSEAELCAQLQVSRVTLRAALEQLHRERWLKGGQGRRRQILRRATMTRAPTSNKVVLLTPLPLSAVPSFIMFWVDNLREHLADAGYQLEVNHGEACYGEHPERALQRLADRLRPAGWVLFRSTEPMQQWFSARRLPVVVTGSRHEHMEFSSVDIDYRAACRHAVGLFLSRGHRRLALINPSSGLAGDKHSEAGFQEGAALAEKPDVEAVVAQHDATVPGICRAVDTLLQRPDPPTALLVSRARHVLTVMTHLGRRRIRVPQDMVLISRDDDSFLKHVVPTVARYSADPLLFARKISRVVLQLVRGSSPGPRDYRIMPKFVPGETLG